MSIPTSDMPGHKRLHDRAHDALDRCQESQGVDFKESAGWAAMQERIIKTVLGMGNLRDGGLIIVGVSERSPSWELTGISDQDLATYDADNILSATNSFASPHVEMDIVVVKYNDGKRYLAIQVHEFEETPLVCKKNSQSRALLEGAVYARPPGMPQTTRIQNAAQMHDLLELAAEKRARRILEIARRVGMVASTPASQLFDRELEGL